MESENKSPNLSLPKILSSGGGKTGALLRSIDWSQHPLGPVEKWPVELLTSLGVMFGSQHPLFIWWGPELFQFYNDAYLPSFGVGKHPLAMGQRGKDCWPETWSIIKPQIDLVLNEGGSTWNEDQLVPYYRNGELDNVYWTYGYSPILNMEGEPAGIFVTCTETSSQVESQKALQESEARLNLALNSANIGFWDWDSRTGDVYLSASLMEDWGIDPKTFSRKLPQCIECIHEDDREMVWDIIRSSNKDNRSYDVEYRVVRPNGEIIWVNAKGRFLIDPEDNSEHLSGVTINITERKDSEQKQFELLQKLNNFSERLIYSKQAAERANESKSAFLANMSHEIRTPLGAILGFADVLKDAATSKEERDRYLDIIMRNGNSLVKIIDDILDLSKIEAGKMELEQSSLSLQDIGREVIDMFSDRAICKKIDLTFVEDGLPNFKIDSDAIRIRQILINLVGNAIKFTNKGRVILSANYQEIESGKVVIKFSVKDTGIGLTEEQAGRLFAPFTQADNESSRRFGGTGLGLALSRKLGIALGGDVYLESYADKQGSTFCFKLTAEKSKNSKLDNETAAKKSPNVKDQPLLAMRILVVDDAPDNRRLIDLYLKDTGAVVTLAPSGTAAVELAAENKFDLILLDIQMPVMDGFETLKKLNVDGFKGSVIALTAHAMKEDREKALAAGFEEHITKPINRTALIETLSGYRCE